MGRHRRPLTITGRFLGDRSMDSATPSMRWSDAFDHILAGGAAANRHVSNINALRLFQHREDRSRLDILAAIPSAMPHPRCLRTWLRLLVRSRPRAVRERPQQFKGGLRTALRAQLRTTMHGRHTFRQRLRRSARLLFLGFARETGDRTGNLRHAPINAALLAAKERASQQANTHRHLGGIPHKRCMYKGLLLRTQILTLDTHVDSIPFPPC